MQSSATDSVQILLTGVTGFVGKVVLEEILRTRPEVARVYVAIRGKGRTTPEARWRSVAQSPCFEGLPAGWADSVRVIGCELAEPGAGVSEADRAELAAHVTHIVHCAASVEFNLPVQQAAEANITASLQMLELARSLPRLVSFVAVSTAYVTPHPGADVPVCEELPHLPRAAEAIYADILAGVPGEQLTAETGHPNTYTLTKCLAEHLLMQRRGTVPLRIVRPSIVSACWKHPFSGWIDSKAAFAAFVAMIGSGQLRAIVAYKHTELDIVPCDVVAERILETAFLPPTQADAQRIRYAVVGRRNLSRVKDTINAILQFFRDHPVDQHPMVAYVGKRGGRYRLTSLWQHHLKANTRHFWADRNQRGKIKRRAKLTLEQTRYLNRAFPYFTQNTFDFRASLPFDDPDFDPVVYARTVCAGVYRFLMRKDETLLTFAGHDHGRLRGDLFWALGQPRGAFKIRAAAYLLRKLFRRCASRITFDERSFEAAREATPPGSLCVLVPTHGSHLDYLLLAYLLFSRPDLSVSTPHTARLRDFAAFPVVGELLRDWFASLGHREANPFLLYLEGGPGKPYRFLRSNRALLDEVARSGAPVSILPVAITYDWPQDPLTQAQSQAKPPRGLFSSTWWAIHHPTPLGRVHLTCGDHQLVEPTADPHQLRRELAAQLQAASAATSHHLRCFVQRTQPEDLAADILGHAVTSRGGRLLASMTDLPETVAAADERRMRLYWAHVFYPDLHTLKPTHAVLHHYLAQNGFVPEEADAETDEPGGSRSQSGDEAPDPRLAALLHTLFEPVCRGYASVAQAAWRVASASASAAADAGRLLTEAELVQPSGVADEDDPRIRALAVRDLVERGWLVAQPAAAQQPVRYRVLGTPEQLAAYAAACAWEPVAVVAAPAGTAAATANGAHASNGGAKAKAEAGAGLGVAVAGVGANGHEHGHDGNGTAAGDSQPSATAAEPSTRAVGPLLSGTTKS